MDIKHTESFELKTVSKKNEGNCFDDFKNLDYKIIELNFSKRKEFPHNRQCIWYSYVIFCVCSNIVN
jgi:hypothetical protein